MRLVDFVEGLLENLAKLILVLTSRIDRVASFHTHVGTLRFLMLTSEGPVSLWAVFLVFLALLVLQDCEAFGGHSFG